MQFRLDRVSLVDLGGNSGVGVHLDLPDGAGHVGDRCAGLVHQCLCEVGEETCVDSFPSRGYLGSHRCAELHLLRQ